MNNDLEPFLASSFRDPCGRVMRLGAQLYRSVTPAGMEDYQHFTRCGLSQSLIEKKVLVPFQEAGRRGDDLLLQIEELPFISYPYEWCFSQLRDAAVLTLRIALDALQKEMILKDASAFNIAWRDGKPIFIDHGSFTCYHDGDPWQAYRQFTMHFLGPLLMMKYRDIRHLQLFRSHLDGLPLDFVSRHLPLKTWFCPGILMHIHLHSRFEQSHSDSMRPVQAKPPKMPRNRLRDMLQYLHDYLEDLKAPQTSSEWGAYYQDTNYSESAFAHKQELVKEFINRVQPRRTVDFGANNGTFSFLATGNSSIVIAADCDAAALESLYQRAQRDFPGVYPVLQDLNNPSPGLGIFNTERESFLSRVRSDLALGLALLHHLRIGSNWTLQQCVELFAQTATNALLEFVPKSDSQVQRLLRTRPDICDDWTLPALLSVCQKYYRACECVPIDDSQRVLIRLQQRL